MIVALLQMGGWLGGGRLAGGRLAGVFPPFHCLKEFLAPLNTLSLEQESVVIK